MSLRLLDPLIGLKGSSLSAERINHVNNDAKKMLNMLAQMRDEKDEIMMRNEKMNVVETPRIKCPRQQHQKMLSHRLSRHRENAQTEGCHPYPRSLHLSRLPRLRGVDPMG